jgi:signal transduction histidine kinase
MVNSADILNAGILVVDDHEVEVSLIARMLRSAGYTSIESTTDPHEVCELYRQNRYGLILLDLQMPGMNGFQVMEGLKEIEGEGYLPVIVTTAEPGHKLRALKAGAKDFISKPFDIAELLARVHNILEVRLLHLKAKNHSTVLAETVRELEASREIIRLKTLAEREKSEQELAIQSALASDNARLYQTAEFARLEAQSASRGLQRSNIDLERFAFVASHDLQEPLRMVTSFSQLLARRYKGQLDERADECLEYILTGTKRMAALIEDLLSYSQIVHLTEKGVPVDSNVVLDKVLESCRIIIEESGAIVTHDPLPTLEGDEGQISQLFHNLLTNALKYRKRDVPPEVHVSAQQTANKWLFSFRDNGIGIAGNHLEQIFVIFKRLHKKTEYPGTGIGLALCQRIIEGRAGRIWVESEPGVGSTFYFTWPDLEEHNVDARIVS